MGQIVLCSESIWIRRHPANQFEAVSSKGSPNSYYMEDMNVQVALARTDFKSMGHLPCFNFSINSTSISSSLRLLSRPSLWPNSAWVNVRVIAPSSRLLDFWSLPDPVGIRLFVLLVSRWRWELVGAFCEGGIISSGGGEPDDGVEGDGETGSCGEFMMMVVIVDVECSR